MDDERDALALRYRTALDDGSRRGARERIESFERATSRSEAVLTCKALVAEAVMTSGLILYSNYYQQTQAQTRLPEPQDARRRRADEVLFPGYKDEIQFAALSLLGAGPASYGECSLVCRDDRIAHRATVFEEDSLHFAERHNYHPLPPGYRATWNERGKLCVAKHADGITPGTPDSQFAGMLQIQGSAKKDEKFVEVHIWGRMSAQTFARVALRPSGRRKSILKVLRERLEKLAIPVEGP